MKKTALFILCLISAVSCQQGTADISNIVLSPEILDSAQTLSPEKVSFNPPIFAKKVFGWNDSIFIVLNDKSSGRRFIELYSSDNNLIRDYFIRGRGPGEMLDASAIYMNDSLLVEDIYLNHLAVISIRQAISAPDFKPELKNYSIQTQSMWPYKNALLAVNPNRFINKKYGINNDGPRFIVSDTAFTYNDSEKYKFTTINVTHSSFIMSYYKNRIFYYSACSPEIEIYDLDLNLLRTVHGPQMSQDIEYYIDDLNDVCFLSNIPYAYMGSCHNSDFVFLCYIGDFLRPENNYDESDFSSYILQFDWDGNFIDSYNIDHYIKSMSLSRDGRYIYAFGTDHDGESVFYKYLLK